MANITEKFVRALKPTNRRQIITDDKLKAFGVRINTSGHMTYIVRYRIGRAQKTLTIGPVAAFTATQARQRAKEAIADVTKGIDPQCKKIQRRQMPLLKEWVLEYLDTSTNITLKDEHTRSKPFISALGGHPLDSISTQDIRRVLKQLSDKGKAPSTINRHRSLIRKIFQNAIQAGHLNENPVAAIEVLQENNEIERHFSPDETARFLAALENAPTNSKNAIKALYLTGRRRGDVLKMRWEDIDKASGHWRIPKPKSQKTQYSPLTPALLEVIEEQRKNRVAFNEYVFPGRSGRGHLKDLSKIFQQILSEAHISNFRLHDLRHNYGSQLAMSQHSIYTIGKLLGHSDGKTTQRYAHLSDQTLRDTATAAVIKLSNVHKKVENE